MRDPYLMEHDAYLNHLEHFAAPKRMRDYRPDKDQDWGIQLRAMVVVAAVVVVFAFQPWTI
ncbi:MAG: hypothetical protein OEZ19_06645 [Paracoccaceae bacterium]|nr:hypothetical protein [Paracoccaceae bacterium]